MNSAEVALLHDFFFWRVEVKLTCCSPDIFHDYFAFSVFLCSVALLVVFLFLYSIAVTLTSFLDFRSISSAVAWNSAMCQTFFALSFSIPSLGNCPRGYSLEH